MRSDNPWPSLSRTVVSSPHRTGEGIPDGAMNFETVLNIWPTKPCGSPIGHGNGSARRHTRSSSLATRSGRGANIAPIKLATTSKLASSNGSASASATSKRAQQTFRLCARPCALHPIAGDVHTGNVQAILRGNQSELAGAAANIQEAAPRSRIEALVEIACAAFHVPRESIVVSGHPGVLEPSTSGSRLPGAIAMVVMGFLLFCTIELCPEQLFAASAVLTQSYAEDAFGTTYPSVWLS